MKNTVLLDKNWCIKKILPAESIDPRDYAVDDRDWLTISSMPAQVHDVLLEHGLISEEMLLGWCEDAVWTDEYDWVYRCFFTCGPSEGAYLNFAGLDTIADIYLNGVKIGRHDDFYTSRKIQIAGLLEVNNVLLIHFHNIRGHLKTLELDPSWDNAVMKCKLIRKPIHDFPPDKIEGSNYQGAHPYFSPIGVYRDVTLTIPDGPEIEECELRAVLQDMNCGEIRLAVAGYGTAKGLNVTVSTTDEAGRECAGGECCVKPVLSGWKAELTLPVNDPRLWWPRGFGSQPLYSVRISLFQDGKLCDRIQKSVGFRKIEMPSPLEFIINGKRVRLWGGSMDPLQGYTHCWRPERAKRMFEMVENANMNTLRIWGEGIPYPDEFYDETDRRGILVWQEFFMGHGAYPDTREYQDKCVQEACELVLRLRHRPSLLMWCGGNETIMGAEFQGKTPHGSQILLEAFPKLLSEVDPQRYYHPNSPYGGEYANDPREGDHHTYECVWQYPYADYPNFMSEHIRTAPPVLHSLKKMIRGELWPRDYTGKFLYGTRFPMPDSWARRSHHPAKGELKTGPYWEYYDADTPEELIYRFGAAYGQEVRRGLEMIRMGSSDGNAEPGKRSKGHFSCKLLDTWPKVYCSIIDYFQEAYIPYYATGRAQAPLLVCFDRKDSIRLWLVNDSAQDFSGHIKFGLYSLSKECFLAEKLIDASMPQGEAGILFDLAALHFFPKDCLLAARLEDQNGGVICSSVDYVDIERHLNFPDARLSVSITGNVLNIVSDRFARCVEITGECDGNPFGWLFEDNYFDLMPGETKTVSILGDIPYGRITLKPHYSPHAAEISFKRV
ncbi:beta-mannosidase [Ruminiclostridium cellobioparum]|uniref:Beta-mannosidase n=1 Tax=Ruminiclostridium cellobioparum subsp. termitidis CT1112 TaxID=1195236 RepID=S0FLG7_RUMCE|nr:glycoside hydrolase family 2 protein [Ruminiclostridium cellobioparum]EMS70009.1 Beta-galactosidase/beta-glucuronidase [Ruminiclostridium cellobioparum subsp. termitidis CT1112]